MPTLDRRSFLKTTGVLGAGLALGACGGSEGSSGTSTGSAASTGRLRGTATFTTWGADAEIAAFRRIAADFEAARGATVEIEVLPYDQIRTVVDRRLQAQQPPDLFRVSYTDVGGYARTGALADLSDHLEDGFGDDFLPALWGSVSLDGVPVGVPHHTDTSALAYNKTHFERAGITEVPTSLDTAWTWEEFTDVLRRLDAAQLGAEPFAFNYQLFGAYRFFNTVYQAGGSVLDDDLEQVTLDTPEARKALEFVRGLYEQGLHASNVLVKRPTYPDEIFPTGKLSMVQTGDFLIPSLEAAIGDRFEWGVTYLMRDEQAATDLGGNAVVVTEGAPNRDVAAEFAKFLVTKENMALFCQETTVLPVRKDLVEEELAYAVRPDLMPVFQQQATTMPEGLVRVSTSPAFPGINQVLVDSMDQYLSDPSASTDDVVERLTDGIEKALQAQA